MRARAAKTRVTRKTRTI